MSTRSIVPALPVMLFAIIGCDRTVPSASDPPQFAKAGTQSVTMTDIRPGGLSADARGINDQGIIVGGTRPASPGYQDGIQWNLTGATSYTWAMLGVLPGGTKSSGVDVNASGVIAGWSDGVASSGFVLPPGGSMIPLPLPTGGDPGSIYLYDLSDGGHVVGMISFPEEGVTRAALWTLAADASSVQSVELLPSPDPERPFGSSARDANDAGTIVVGAAIWPGRSVFGDPTLWTRTDDGGWSMKRLEVQPGHDRGAANSVNAAGQIAGYGASTASCMGRAIVWTPLADESHRMTALPTTGGCTASAAAMNDRGQVVGQSNDKSNTPSAALWSVSASGDVLSVRSLGRLKGTYQSAAADLDSGAGGVLRVVGMSVEWPDAVHRATLWTVR